MDDPLLLTNGELPIESALYALDQRILDTYSLLEIERNVEDLQFTYSYKLCAHISLDDKKQLNVCTNLAGLQTNHEGVGRCHVHDKQLFKIRSPYTRHLRHFETLQEVFENFQNREKKLNDLSDEMNMARMVLTMQLQDFEKGKRAKNDDVFRNAVVALDLIRKIGESIAKIQQAESSGITLQAITAFLWQISDILNQEIPEADRRIRILDRISSEATFIQ